MDRRSAVKSIVLASGALLTLPSWANGWSANTLDLDASSFTATDQEILTAGADAIIPAGNSIGATSVGVGRFLQKLFDDCYEPEVRDNIIRQLASLESDAQATYQKPFAACDVLQRQSLLLKRSASENKDEKDFFALFKGETIRGFSTSREVMTSWLHYKVAPGHFYGCVDVTP